MLLERVSTEKRGVLRTTFINPSCLLGIVRPIEDMLKFVCNHIMGSFTIRIQRVCIDIEYFTFVTANREATKSRVSEDPSALIRWIEKTCRILIAIIFISNIEQQ